jgi:SAM-dependent methyltransferase
MAASPVFSISQKRLRSTPFGPDGRLLAASGSRPYERRDNVMRGGMGRERLALGIVERIGPRGISGWVDHAGGGREVLILVNGREVSRTMACRPVAHSEGVRDFGFARQLSDLWSMLGPDDVLEVRHDGSSLPIVGHGFSYKYRDAGASRFSELRSKIDDGWVFDKTGKLSMPFSRQPRLEGFFSEFAKLFAHVEAALGYKLFPIYGTLLGCIREGDFIAHDDDIDLTYISKHRRPGDLKGEFLRLCSVLVDLGYQSELLNYGVAIKKPITVDIYPSFFSEAGQFQVLFGYHGSELPYSEQFFRFREAQLGGHKVLVPENSEDILAQLYGTGWRIPDPGFTHHTRQRKFDARYQLTEQETVSVFWKQFYAYHKISEPSSFGRFALDRIPETALVLDIGCGTGRDSVFLAKGASQVIGMDASREAIMRAEALRSETGTTNCHFKVVDIMDPSALAEFLQAPEIQAKHKSSDPVIVYCRFFFHAITSEAQMALLDALRSRLDRFILFAEFRTDQDEALPKDNARHYRRYISPDSFIEELTGRYKMKIEYQQVGFGLSIYNEEDPHLCRLIARTTSATDA